MAMASYDAAAVHRLLGYGRLIEAFAAAHRRMPPLIGRQVLAGPPDASGAATGFLVLPAWAGGRLLGVKMATVFPGNRDRPSVQAVYQLFDGRNGTPLALIDGTALTLRKTAADSGLGCRLLAREDAATLLMIGAGALAPHLIAAHRTARPSLARVLIWNRTAARADALAASLQAEGVPAEAIADLEAGLRAADVISVATMATAPLVQGALLRPGAHVDLVGAYMPQMRESDDETVRRATLFVDWRGSTVGESGDLVQPLAEGVIAEGDIRADLFELCQGLHPGRSAAEEITLFKNGGGGHLDLFTAEALIEAAGRG
jgi:ornithine cyclodeaminase